MEKLKELQLYGKGLIEIKSKEMVNRYNSALQCIGLDPTALKKFFIDGWGWSPDISLEKQDNFYLSHGLANPFAIIITPEQYDVPVYMPCHSFDNRIKNHVFETFSAQIHDLTTQTAIIIECDQEISSYRSPQDLLGIEFFTLRFTTSDNLSEAKEAQMNLERKFYDEESAWADKDLRDLLRSSYRKYGVLADKKFLLPDHPFLDVDSFHSCAFGGMFLFRNLKALGQSLLVLEQTSENEHLVHGQASEHLEYHISDPKLTELLITKNVIGIFPEKLPEQTEDIERMLTLTLAEVLFEKEPELNVDELTSGQVKKYINLYTKSGELSEHYFELETILYQIKKGQNIDPNKLSSHVYKLLMRPHPDLDANLSWLLWRVILKIKPFDLFRLYIYDKQEFYDRYTTWPEAKKRWAINYIKPRYITTKEMNNS